MTTADKDSSRLPPESQPQAETHPPAPTRAEQRQARLAAELRANLSKRKRQAKARRAEPTDAGPVDDDPNTD